MKIIECMAEIKLLDKKLKSKVEFIQRYAARPSFREDAFNPKNPELGEKKKVEEALQAAKDLIERLEDIKRRLDYTNIMTEVEICGKRYTIHSLILHQRHIIKMKKSVLAALNDQHAQIEVNNLRQKQGSDSKLSVQVVYGYDIQKKETDMEELIELEANVDSCLQIANARIELLDVPAGKK